MNTRLLFLLSLLPAALLTSCARAANRAAPHTTTPAVARADVRTDVRDEARRTLLAADREHAAASARAQSTGFPSALADDAVLLYPNRPIVRGRAAVAELLASLPEAAGRTMTWRPVLADVSADGTRGYTVGYGERAGMTESSGSPWIKYISFWRRGDDGRWKVAAWVLTGGAAGAPAGAPAACAWPATLPAPVAGLADTSGAGAPYGENVSGATRDALLRADSAFSALSARAGAGEAFGTYVADGGATLGGRDVEVTCGRDAVRRALAGVPPGAIVWHPRIADAAASGDLGYTIGIATIRGEATSHYSKYLTVWKKQPDGTWRFVADGGNPTPSP